jgi:hypothetical protein
MLASCLLLWGFMEVASKLNAVNDTRSNAEEALKAIKVNFMTECLKSQSKSIYTTDVRSGDWMFCESKYKENVTDQKLL